MKEKLESLVQEMVERRIYLDEAVNEFEKRFIRRVLEMTKGNQVRASQQLGIHRNTLRKKIEEFDLDHRPKRKTAAKARR